MSDLSAEIGRSMIGRQLARITLPGAVFGLAAVAAVTTGQRRAIDVDLLVETLSSLPSGTPESLSIDQSWFLVGAAAGSIIAFLIGQAVQCWWFRSTRPSKGKWWIKLLPRGRMFELYERASNRHGLSISSVWTKVWTALPETDRHELHLARASIAGASTSLGWGISWLLLGALWWPSFFIAIAFAAVGCHQFRSSAQNYAQLVERHAVDQCAILAIEFGLTHDAALHKQAGFALSAYLEDPRKFEMLQNLRAQQRLAGINWRSNGRPLCRSLVPIHRAEPFVPGDSSHSLPASACSPSRSVGGWGQG